MAIIEYVDGGVLINGRFTSNEAIEDVKNWAKVSPELIPLIFTEEELRGFASAEIPCMSSAELCNPQGCSPA